MISDSFSVIFTGVTYNATQSGSASGSQPAAVVISVTMPSGAKTLTRRREKSARPLRAGVTDSNPANNGATDTDTL